MRLKQCVLRACEGREPLRLSLSTIRALRSLKKTWLPPLLGFLSCAAGRGQLGLLIQMSKSGSCLLPAKGYRIGGIMAHEQVKFDMFQLVPGQKGGGGMEERQP